MDNLKIYVFIAFFFGMGGYFSYDYLTDASPDSKADLVQVEGRIENYWPTINLSSGSNGATTFTLTNHQHAFTIPVPYFAGYYSQKMDRHAEDDEVWEVLIAKADLERLKSDDSERLLAVGVSAGEEILLDPEEVLEEIAASKTAKLYYIFGFLGMGILILGIFLKWGRR